MGFSKETRLRGENWVMKGGLGRERRRGWGWFAQGAGRQPFVVGRAVELPSYVLAPLSCL